MSPVPAVRTRRRRRSGPQSMAGRPEQERSNTVWLSSTRSGPCWPRCGTRCTSSKAISSARGVVLTGWRARRSTCGTLWQREDTSVGIEMLVDAAVDFLTAFRALEAGILDAQAEVDTLEAEMVDDEDGQEA